MIPICADLQKLYLVSLTDLQTDLLQSGINLLTEYHSPVFGRTYDVIQQDRDVVALVDDFTHPLSLAQQAAGN